MKIKINSLRSKMFFWYISSLLVIVAYILLFIHYRTIEYGMIILAAIFVILAVIQFFIIFDITRSITHLSQRIKNITSQNLDERITDIHGEDEIGELAQSFNGLMDRLNEAFQRERQFIGDVAHELKTPIATLRSSFEIALTQERKLDEYKKALKDAIVETDELTSTLKNVLDLAWSEAPNKQQNKKKFNLSELIDDIYEIAQKMAMKKYIKVTLSNTPDIHIEGYKDKFARALLNIIENAIKYTPERGSVELILEKTSNKILFSVMDNGRGISPDEIPHIFDRFYRGAKTDHVLGSGLGLAIVKSIVTLHQGEIKVKSYVGKGSTFVVVIPTAYS